MVGRVPTWMASRVILTTTQCARNVCLWQMKHSHSAKPLKIFGGALPSYTPPSQSGGKFILSGRQAPPMLGRRCGPPCTNTPITSFNPLIHSQPQIPLHPRCATTFDRVTSRLPACRPPYPPPGPCALRSLPARLKAAVAVSTLFTIAPKPMAHHSRASPKFDLAKTF